MNGDNEISIKARPKIGRQWEKDLKAAPAAFSFVRTPSRAIGALPCNAHFPKPAVANG